MYKKWTIIDEICELICEEDFKLLEILLEELYTYYRMDNILFETKDYIVLKNIIIDKVNISYYELARKLGYRSKTSISRCIGKIETNIVTLIKKDSRFQPIKKKIEKKF